MARIHHENKEFKKELIKLFTDFFEEERIKEEFNKNNPNYKPITLDGGCTKELRDNSKKYFKKFDELKNKYGITDK